MEHPRKKPQPKQAPERKSWNARTISYLTQDEMRKLLAVIENPRDFAIFLLDLQEGP
jgi:hypothetical protein